MDDLSQQEEKIRQYAVDNGYSVSEENLPGILEGLAARKERYGEYYCPCRAVAVGKSAYLESIKCPCAFVHADIRREGHCHCLLFFSSQDPSMVTPISLNRFTH